MYLSANRIANNCVAWCRQTSREAQKKGNKGRKPAGWILSLVVHHTTSTYLADTMVAICLHWSDSQSVSENFKLRWSQCLTSCMTWWEPMVKKLLSNSKIYLYSLLDGGATTPCPSLARAGSKMEMRWGQLTMRGCVFCSTLFFGTMFCSTLSSIKLIFYLLSFLVQCKLRCSI